LLFADTGEIVFRFYFTILIDNAQVRFAKSYLTNFECKPESFLEVVDIAVVSEFTGYDRRTIGQWIRT
jgi:hypothetical protein